MPVYVSICLTAQLSICLHGQLSSHSMDENRVLLKSLNKHQFSLSSGKDKRHFIPRPKCIFREYSTMYPTPLMRSHWNCQGSKAMAIAFINFTHEISGCTSHVILHLFYLLISSNYDLLICLYMLPNHHLYVNFVVDISEYRWKYTAKILWNIEPLLDNGSINTFPQRHSWQTAHCWIMRTTICEHKGHPLLGSGCVFCAVVWLEVSMTVTRVEAGSNTSIVTLRVIGGDEKGSLESETVKCGHESYGTRTWKWLRWRGPAAIVNNRPVL
jgi:hypothetical protein